MSHSRHSHARWFEKAKSYTDLQNRSKPEKVHMPTVYDDPRVGQRVIGCHKGKYNGIVVAKLPPRNRDPNSPVWLVVDDDGKEHRVSNSVFWSQFSYKRSQAALSLEQDYAD